MASLIADIELRPDVQAYFVAGNALVENERLFAAEIGVAASHLIQVSHRELRLRLVPTLVLVDQDGRILLSREGIVTESDRNDVIALLGTR